MKTLLAIALAALVVPNRAQAAPRAMAPAALKTSIKSQLNADKFGQGNPGGVKYVVSLGKATSSYQSNGMTVHADSTVFKAIAERGAGYGNMSETGNVTAAGKIIPGSVTTYGPY
jgi:hypothetical protein